MNVNEKQAIPAQPSLVAALMAGFDAIANHIGLILFPFVLDLFLWFGPHLRLKILVESAVNQMLSLPGLDTSATNTALQFNRDLWLQIGERLNLFSALRTYPVGIPSLMASRQPVDIPIGLPLAWDVSSLGSLAAWWLLLTLLGLFAGVLYFALVAQVSLTGKIEWRTALEQWPWATLQVIYLALFMAALLLAISVPGSCLVAAASFTGLPIVQIGFLLTGAVALWLLFPLLFSAHGIFAFQYKMWSSVRQGARLTRLTLSKTSLLFLSILVISEGLDTLWRVPAEKSWITLVGVAGHAFVATSLLAASFIYYRDATRWVQRLIQQSLMVEGRNLRERIT